MTIPAYPWAISGSFGAIPAERVSRNERLLWVGLSRPGEAGLMAVMLAVGAVQDHGSEPRNRVVCRPSPFAQPEMPEL